MVRIATPQEMAAIDDAAPEDVTVLIERAGAAVARHALKLMGGSYGRRVVVIAGGGNNGADGVVAARRLDAAGVRVQVVTPDVDQVPECDLVIDAAFGTGLSRPYDAPDVGSAKVLAVDIPSGINGLTGEAMGKPLRADLTVAFAAAKPGNLFGAGRQLGGRLTVEDIGLDVSGLNADLVTADAVSQMVSPRSFDAHKYESACWVIAGSRGMTGAARLTAGAALRAGSGYVRLSTPGPGAGPEDPIEAVGFTLPTEYWDRDVVYALGKTSSLVIGPGLGLADDTRAAVRSVVAGADVPLVIDGDALTALGKTGERFTAGRSSATVMTPHDGEFTRLMGGTPGSDRIAAARAMAKRFDATVLLKGPTTVCADADGKVLVVTAGSNRLATAGTGDVLSGIIGAFLARGAGSLEAATAAAFVHGTAASLCSSGMIASDLLKSLPEALSSIGVTE